MAKSTFQYKPRTAEATKARATAKGGMFDSITKNGVPTFTPAAGDNTVRFLPAQWEGAEHYAFDVWTHNNVGGDRNQYICLDKMKKQKCPVCEYRKELEREGGDKDEIKALQPKQRCAAWIVDRATEKEGPKLWIMGWTLDKEIASLSVNKKNGAVLFIDNPEDGYDVSFTREGQGLKTRYNGVQIDRDPTPISAKQSRQQTIEDFVADNPVPDTLQYYPYDHITAVLNGKAKADDDDDEVVATAATRRRVRDQAEEEPEQPARRRAAQPADEEEAEEAPPPRRRPARAAEPEEEEPEIPRRRRGDPPDEEEIEAGRAAAQGAPVRRRPVEPEDEAEEPPPRRRPVAREPEEEAEPAPRRRISDAPPATRRRAAEEEELEEAPPPRRRAAPPADEEPEEPPTRRRPAADPEDVEEPSRRRPARAAAEDEEAEPVPRSTAGARRSLSRLREGD